jgi:hypothetical protein
MFHIAANRHNRFGLVNANYSTCNTGSPWYLSGLGHTIQLCHKRAIASRGLCARGGLPLRCRRSQELHTAQRDRASCLACAFAPPRPAVTTSCLRPIRTQAVNGEGILSTLADADRRTAGLASRDGTTHQLDCVVCFVPLVQLVVVRGVLGCVEIAGVVMLQRWGSAAGRCGGWEARGRRPDGHIYNGDTEIENDGQMCHNLPASLPITACERNEYTSAQPTALTAKLVLLKNWR